MEEGRGRREEGGGRREEGAGSREQGAGSREQGGDKTNSTLKPFKLFLTFSLSRNWSAVAAFLEPLTLG
jgi:hypothetical protein